MARNRKNQTAVRFGPLILVVLLCLFFGGAGVGYVWQVKQIETLDRQIRERETQLAELQRQNKMRGDHLAAQTSPVALEARIRKLNLGLVQPPLTQIIRLPDAEPGVLTPDHPEFAAGAGHEPGRPDVNN